MIFKEKVERINKCLKVGYKIEEVMKKNMGMGDYERSERDIEIMEMVGISDEEESMKRLKKKM